MLNLWAPHSLQYIMTFFDVRHYKYFHESTNGLTKITFSFTICIKTLRDAAARKMEIGMHRPMPGGAEELALKNEKEINSTIRSYLPSLSASSNRNYGEIRSDIVSNSVDFISQRLNVENGRSIELIKKLTTVNTKEF